MDQSAVMMTNSGMNRPTTATGSIDSKEFMLKSATSNFAASSKDANS
jgi:hypothetical protein